MRTIMITGVCGVGKSTITRELSSRLGLTWGDYADMMLEVMGIDNKDQIQKLGWDERRKVYDQVEALMAVRYSKANVDRRVHLLENHLTIVQDGKLISFETPDYNKYNMAGLIIVEADPEDVMNRRLGDEIRKRNIDTTDLIREQQETNMQEASKIAAYLGIPVLRIKNEYGKLPIDEIEVWARRAISGEGNGKSVEMI